MNWTEIISPSNQFLVTTVPTHDARSRSGKKKPRGWIKHERSNHIPWYDYQMSCHKRHWVGVKLLCATDSSSSSTARRGCKCRRGCNNHTRVIPQTGVTRIIRLIYIQNTAQGDEHDNLPSAESEPWGGEKNTAEKKFERERAALNQNQVFRQRRTNACWALCPTFGYGRFEIRRKGDNTEPQYRQTVVGCWKT